jgi:hypothetical protein
MIELKHCRFEDQLAGFMTKHLKIDNFCKLREGVDILYDNQLKEGFCWAFVLVALGFSPFCVLCIDSL